MNTKKKYLLLCLGIFLMVITSCSSDDDGNGNNTSAEANVLVVYLKGNSSGIDVQWGSETFCYDDDDCNTITGNSFASTFGDSRLDMTSSNSSKLATGVNIPSIQVNSGSGVIQVVRVIATTVDGFEEFEEVETVFTSQELNSGDTFSLEYGVTE